MKRAIQVITIVCLSLIAGWSAGYLNVPYLKEMTPFWLAFLLGTSLALLIVLIISLWRQKSTSTDSAPTSQRSLFVAIVSCASVLIAFALFAFVNLRQQHKLELQVEQLESAVVWGESRITAVTNNNMASLMPALIEEVKQELAVEPIGRISEALLTRVAAFSKAFQPYSETITDSLQSPIDSPERGQLLIALLNLDIAKEDFDKIKQTTSFSYANLSRLDVHGSDLSGINLSDAICIDANFQGGNLLHSNLYNTDLTRANLNDVDLRHSDLRQGRSTWAELRNIKLDSARMNGMALSHAKLNNASMRGAIVKWGNITGASLAGANLERANLWGLTMHNANLSGANLTGANLVRAKLHGADLTEATLDSAIVLEENWLSLLQEWNVGGFKHITETYELVPAGSFFILDRIRD